MTKIAGSLEDLLEAQSQLIIYLAHALHANAILPLSDFANWIRKQNEKLPISPGAKRILASFADELEPAADRPAPTFTVIQGGKTDDPAPDGSGAA